LEASRGKSSGETGKPVSIMKNILLRTEAVVGETCDRTPRGAEAALWA